MSFLEITKKYPEIFSLPEKTEFLAGVVGSKISQSLLQFLVHEDSLGAFKEGYKPLVRSRDESVKNLARKALSEIESVNQILEGTIDIARNLL